MGQHSGALYVQVGDTWHPVLNLVSARLIAGTAASPELVQESDLGRTKRGPLLGIPGAPQFVGEPLSADESAWTICDADGTGATTVVVGPTDASPVRRLAAGHALLVAPASGSPAYLRYNGQRAVVDVADAAVLRALRLEGRAPRLVSQSLLNAVPEAPPITAPPIRGAGEVAAGFPVGSVLRIARGDGDEYYVVCPPASSASARWPPMCCASAIRTAPPTRSRSRPTRSARLQLSTRCRWPIFPTGRRS